MAGGLTERQIILVNPAEEGRYPARPDENVEGAEKDRCRKTQQVMNRTRFL